MKGNGHNDTSAPADTEEREWTEEENRKSYFDIALTLIEKGLEEEAKGRKDWIEGTIMLIEALDHGRKRLGDQAFGKWLTDNGYGEERITRHDRSALLNMAIDLDITSEVLAQTHRRSWRLIWEEEIQPRLPTAGQPGGNGDPEKKTRRGKKKRAKTPANEPEWLRDTKGWFNNQVERVNAVIDELNKIMEDCTPEQHKLLTDLEPDLLLEAFRNGEKKCAKFVNWVETPLEKAADKLIGEGRVRIAPARRRPAQPVQPGA